MRLPEKSFLIAAAFCGVSACVPSHPPTLSRERGAEYLAAMAEANTHLNAHDTVTAANDFSRAAQTAERRVDRDEALFREAMTRLHSDPPEVEKSLALLDEVARERPTSRRTGRALFEASRLRISHGERELGLRGLEAFISEFPDHGDGSHALRILLEENSTQSISSRISWLETLYQHGAKDGDVGDDVLMARAELMHESGDLAAAMNELERLLLNHPYPFGQRWDDASLRLADFAEEANDEPRAAATIERMLSVWEPTGIPGSFTLAGFTKGLLRLAQIYRDKLHDPTRALSTYARLYDDMRFSLLRAEALVEAAEVLAAQNENARACSLVHRVISDFPDARARERAVSLEPSLCQTAR